MMKVSTKIVLGIITAGCALSARAESSPSANNSMMTDAQIAEVLEKANKGEAEAGQMAVDKASNAKVKEFAQMMVTEHKAGLEETQKMYTDNKLKPQKNASSSWIEGAAKAEKKKLEKLSGADFDKAYMDGQISMHKEVLKTIDTKLLPSAKNGSTKDLVQKMRPQIEAHLKQAEDIRKSL